MTNSYCRWKPNWEETRQHFVDWWNRKGLILGSWSAPFVGQPIEPTPDPGPGKGSAANHLDYQWRAASIHWALARCRCPADTFPSASATLGPGSLATFLGSEPEFAAGTVWYHPCITDPDRTGTLKFDPENRWWKLTEAQMRQCVKLAGDRYFVGCPDLIENLDILAAMRDPQLLLEDMIDRPAWVEQKIWEINEVFFDAYQRVYDIIKKPDGSSVFSAFHIWGPGKTVKVQCDASAMFSPAMFKQFVVPALTQQCEWLDYSMFHLDGHQCFPHLDLLLGIEALDAIEWTPDPQVPGGGSPQWYDLYKRILKAGKSVQAIGVQPDEIIPLLDAVGGKGMYIMTSFQTVDEWEAMSQRVKAYR